MLNINKIYFISSKYGVERALPSYHPAAAPKASRCPPMQLQTTNMRTYVSHGQRPRREMIIPVGLNACPVILCPINKKWHIFSARNRTRNRGVQQCYSIFPWISKKNPSSVEARGKLLHDNYYWMYRNTENWIQLNQFQRKLLMSKILKQNWSQNSVTKPQINNISKTMDTTHKHSDLENFQTLLIHCCSQVIVLGWNI